MTTMSKTIQMPQQLQFMFDQFLQSTIPQISFETWARRWLQSYQLNRIKTYWTTYKEPVELHLIPHFGERQMTEILPIDISDYFKAAGRRYSLETLKKDKMCLDGIFETAVENGICTKNPVTSTLRLSSKIPPREKHVWNQEQYDIAFAYAKRNSYVDIMVLMETGITRSELLGLTWEDFDPAQRLLILRNGLVQLINSETEKLELVHSGLKNKYRHRAVPISKEIVTRLNFLPRVLYVGGNAKKHTLARKVVPEYIFCAPEGGPYQPSNWYHRRYRPFMKALMEECPTIMPLTPHELRHTKASLLVNDGVSPFFVAKLLGHSNLDMLSKRYAHEDMDALRRALHM